MSAEVGVPLGRFGGWGDLPIRVVERALVVTTSSTARVADRTTPVGEGTAAGVRAREVMTTPVVTVSPDTPAGEIAEALTRHRISAIPVIDETGGVVGLVSDYDLLATPGRTAREVMTTAVISVTEDTDIGDVRQLLVDRRIRRLPVLAGGRLVGIVSRADVVALMGDRVGVPGVRRTGPWRRPAGCVSEVSGRQGAVRPAGAAARNLSAAASAPTDGYTR